MNFVGDSYHLPDHKAASLRTVNLYLRAMESSTNTKAVLVAFPGLRRVATPSGICRGAIEARGRGFVVYDNRLYETGGTDGLTLRGLLRTSTGRVGLAEGLSQLVIVDGVNGYVFRLATNMLEEITSVAWMGSNTVAFINNRFIFHKPASQIWYYSAIDDATVLDALDFASAESSPDDLVAVVADHQEVVLLGTKSTDVYYDAGLEDFTFSRNSGATAEVGCVAAHSVCRLDNGRVWLGSDLNGAGSVYRAQSYTPQRVSTAAIEYEIAKSDDKAGSYAFAMSVNGSMYYVLQVPGLETTWALDMAHGRWVELGEVGTDGEFMPWRGVAHMYAHGRNYIGGSDGGLYVLDDTWHKYGEDERVCERRAPAANAGLLSRRFHGSFVAEIEARDVPSDFTPMVDLSWSDDGGYTFGNEVPRSIGRIGERPPRIVWARTGSSRTRVWKMRYSGASGFTIINAGTQGGG